MENNAEKPDEISALEKFMRENGFTRKDLAVQLGSRSRVSEILSGKRRLSISMIKNIVNNWGMDANLLFRKNPENFPAVSGSKSPTKASGKKNDSILWLLD